MGKKNSSDKKKEEVKAKLEAQRAAHKGSTELEVEEIRNLKQRIEESTPERGVLIRR